MGDPGKLRAKFKGPGHPWNKARIDEEKALIREYGLKNKQELWRASSNLKKATAQAKKLIAATGTQADKERGQLLSRLQRYGLVKTGAELDDILGLSVKDFLSRRLQTVLFRKGLARSVKQARQFITHNQVICGGKKVTAPSYFVSLEEESTIDFAANSALANSEHPERKQPEKPPEAITESEDKNEEKAEKPKKKAAKPAKKEEKAEKPEVKAEEKPDEKK